MASTSSNRSTGRDELAGVTAQHVVDALRDRVPESINGWGVEVEGRRFPVVQVWTCLTGRPRSGNNTIRTSVLLERLGFRPFHRRRPDSVLAAGRNTGKGERGADAGQDSETAARRLGALMAAVRFLGGRPEARVADVLDVAHEFEEWLAR